MVGASPLVYVEWVDSGAADGWEAAGDAMRRAQEDSLVCESAGWLIADEADYVLLAPSRKPTESPMNDEVLTTLQIPRAAIRTMRELSLGPRYGPYR